MPPTCARCSDREADRKLFPPGEWVEYLREERGMRSPEGDLAVPLCGDCNDRLVLLRQGFREFGDLDAERRAEIRDRYEAELDDLALGALVDETGQTPEDRQSVS